MARTAIPKYIEQHFFYFNESVCLLITLKRKSPSATLECGESKILFLKIVNIWTILTPLNYTRAYKYMLCMHERIEAGDNPLYVINNIYNEFHVVVYYIIYV